VSATLGSEEVLHRDLLYEFHAGQHASHYGVLEFRSPLTAYGITASVDGVDGINQGDSNSLAAQSREPGIESGIVKVGPSSPFPTRTKMRLKLLAAGIPTATSPDGADPPQGPAARDALLPCLRRSVPISQPIQPFIVERASPARHSPLASMSSNQYEETPNSQRAKTKGNHQVTNCLGPFAQDVTNKCKSKANFQYHRLSRQPGRVAALAKRQSKANSRL
jgi:hypothetical protein